jgi:hypothetical protein
MVKKNNFWNGWMGANKTKRKQMILTLMGVDEENVDLILNYLEDLAECLTKF